MLHFGFKDPCEIHYELRNSTLEVCGICVWITNSHKEVHAMEYKILRHQTKFRFLCFLHHALKCYYTIKTNKIHLF